MSKTVFKYTIIWSSFNHQLHFDQTIDEGNHYCIITVSSVISFGRTRRNTSSCEVHPSTKQILSYPGWHFMFTGKLEGLGDAVCWRAIIWKVEIGMAVIRRGNVVRQLAISVTLWTPTRHCGIWRHHIRITASLHQQEEINLLQSWTAPGWGDHCYVSNMVW